MVAWLRRLSALVRRRNLDDELASEIEMHIDLRRQAAGVLAIEGSRNRSDLRARAVERHAWPQPPNCLEPPPERALSEPVVAPVAAVAANSVVQRTHEIGLRMALGATAWDATSLMMTKLVRPVLGGIAAGLLVAALLSRALSSQLYGLSSLDPIAFGSAVLLMIAASTLAASLRARRAAHVDPVVALRAE